MLLLSVSEDGYVEGGALEMLCELCHDCQELLFCEVGFQGVDETGCDDDDDDADDDAAEGAFITGDRIIEGDIPGLLASFPPKMTQMQCSAMQ